MADLFGASEEGEMDTQETQAGRNGAPEAQGADTGTLPAAAAANKPQKSAAPDAKSSASPAANAAAPRFEESFARLEALVGEMERGELELEQLLERFEEGVRLVKHCNEFLRQAQLRVERYVEQKDGHWVLKELDEQ
jgi:exodeoxyribonuclease VII small subunit